MTEAHREKLAKGLALFDFDGTLIPWDTQVVFANRVLKDEPLRRSYLAMFAAFAPMAKLIGDEGMKRVFLSYLWRADREQIRSWAEEFVDEWVPEKCYPEVLEMLERHKQAGHLTVLASASPQFYVGVVGRRLGFDLALGTEIEFVGKMPLLPHLVNHKGAEKVRRLSEILGAPPEGVWPDSHGYTDSTADLPMMESCGKGTVVNPSERLTEIAEDRGWEIVRPAVPWKSAGDKAVRILRFAAGF